MKPARVLLILVFTSFFSIQIYSQNARPIYNLNFEKYIPGDKFPELWFEGGTQDYSFKIDSAIKSSGKYSFSIESPTDKKKESFGSLASVVPADFKGQSVTLKGKMKLENVRDGFAGLLLRTDGKSGLLKFDNMQSKNISGTIDWMEYSVTIPLDAEAKQIYYGALLTGSGKLWLDDFSLQIDDKDISLAEIRPAKTYKADLDKEFDSGSNVVINELNESSINNLFILGKLWGFLKYYHPKIADGEYNWDYELFRITPKIISAKSVNERNTILLEWVNSLGAITEFNDVKIDTIKNATIYPELDWIKDKNIFSDELIARLEEIKSSKRVSDPYYVELHQYVKNPQFKNEAKYEQTDLDDGYRLLGLFRYWNIIEYFFPYKNLIGEDWNGVLKEFIPGFVNEKSKYDYHFNTLKLIARIHDTHANLWGNSSTIINEYKGLRFAVPVITFIEEKAIVTGSHFLKDIIVKNNNKIKTGDEIISVNGKKVTEIIREKLPLTPASNYATQLRDLAFDLLRTNGETISVEVNDGTKTQTVIMDTYPLASLDYEKYYTQNNKKSWSLVNKDIGYIYPGTIKNNELPEMMKAFKNTKGIIIDFRCYPSDFLAFEFAKYLLPEPTDFVKFRSGSLDYPGLFTVNDYIKNGEVNNDYYKGKIIIIVNEQTQSSAEYNTMALRNAPQGKVIGSTTAAADGNVSQFFLPGGLSTMISGIGVLTPDGKETQRIGIVPDVEIKPTVKGIREGKDELLLKAIEMINK
jgi:C-terminal processing protease CtpA/Prc